MNVFFLINNYAKSCEFGDVEEGIVQFLNQLSKKIFFNVITYSDPVKIITQKRSTSLFGNYMDEIRKLDEVDFVGLNDIYKGLKFTLTLIETMIDVNVPSYVILYNNIKNQKYDENIIQLLKNDLGKLNVRISTVGFDSKLLKEIAKIGNGNFCDLSKKLSEVNKEEKKWFECDCYMTCFCENLAMEKKLWKHKNSAVDFTKCFPCLHQTKETKKQSVHFDGDLMDLY